MTRAHRRTYATSWDINHSWAKSAVNVQFGSASVGLALAYRFTARVPYLAPRMTGGAPTPPGAARAQDEPDWSMLGKVAPR